jgi:deoxyribose-phosphate aldolase
MHDRALAAMIDHTLLDPLATSEQINDLIEEAVEWNMAHVCVSPNRVGGAVRAADGRVAVAAVIGFPSGAHPIEVKVAEAEYVARLGATEIDMVINLGSIIEGSESEVEREVAAVVAVATRYDAHVKAILETAALGPDRSVIAAQAALRGGAQWLKTSTGYHSSGGATEIDVRLLHQLVLGRARVKASGGIRTLAHARHMIAAGAERLGTSSGVAILRASQPPAPLRGNR